MPLGLYLMGIGMALNPCAPMGVVLFSAAATSSAFYGACLGFCFGLGAITAPALAYGLGVAYFGQQLRGQLGHWLPRFELASAGLLILVGVNQLARI
jgi:sulfite exporter TauE/SafE